MISPVYHCHAFICNMRRSYLRQLMLVMGLLPGVVLSGCTLQKAAPVATIISQEQFQTLIALTALTDTLPVQALTPELIEEPVLTSDNPFVLTPLPTHTNTATITASSTATIVPTPTDTPPPTISPTVTQTPRPVIPPPVIRINRPAPLSKVISPVQVRAVVPPGAGGIIRVELLGEDGRILARQLLTYPGESLNLSIDLSYEITAVAETGRLQIYTMDEFERTLALSSVELLLLSIGQAEYNPLGELRERLFLIEPKPYQLLVGGRLSVFGKALPGYEHPLMIELIAENGAVLGRRLLNVEPEAGEVYGIFTGEIDYQVSEPTVVLLTLYERRDRLPGFTHITTMEIVLNP
jgi:hypothetical protein